LVLQTFVSVDLLATGTWHAFERALLRLLAHQGFEWVRLTGGAGDRGSDVIGFYRGHYWVGQCKFSVSGTTPGPRVLREELLRASGEYRATRALLATNAPVEERSAVSLAAIELTRNTGIQFTVLGKRALYRLADGLPDEPPNRETNPLREYQREAIARLEDACNTRTGAGAGAIVAMATGTGKSRVMFEFIRSFLDARHGAEVLVLAETIALASQLERTSWDVFPKWITTHLWAGGDTPAYSIGTSVTFATTDSVRAGWGTLARPGKYALVAFDEAHHGAAMGNRDLIQALTPAFKLGMTATPWRGDGRDLEAVFGGHAPLFKLSVVDAIRAGYLAEVSYQVFDDHIDWEAVRGLSAAGMSVRDLNRRLWIPERENQVAAIVRDWIDRLARNGLAPRTLVFCRSIEHVERAVAAMHAAGVPAAALHSGLTRFDVTRTLQQFRDGATRVLAVVDMLNEGIDVPDVQLIVFNRVTHSRRVFLQQLGRGLRRTPDKERLVVLDFVSDIRRLAELVEMDREYAAGSTSPEVLSLPHHLVTFSTDRIGEFAEAYLADVGDLSDTDDDTLDLFPPNVSPS
jgi:superfamily II DNA or RNA helicase